MTRRLKHRKNRVVTAPAPAPNPLPTDSNFLILEILAALENTITAMAAEQLRFEEARLDFVRQLAHLTLGTIDVAVVISHEKVLTAATKTRDDHVAALNTFAIALTAALEHYRLSAVDTLLAAVAARLHAIDPASAEAARLWALIESITQGKPIPNPPPAAQPPTESPPPPVSPPPDPASPPTPQSPQHPTELTPHPKAGDDDRPADHAPAEHAHEPSKRRKKT